MSIRVLVCDDHQIVRLGIRSAITELGDIEIVAEAFDGANAVSQCVESAPDVVLMDIRMPRMDGIEATRQIKSNLQLKNTHVLMLTSNDNEEDLFAALAAGADGYCLKDTPAKNLVLAIQAVYAGATWLDPQIARLVLRSATSGVTDSTAATSPEESSFGLSLRELDVLRLLVDGLSNIEMSDRLAISPETVKSHMKHIMEKLEVSDRTQAAVKALREGVV